MKLHELFRYFANWSFKNSNNSRNRIFIFPEVCAKRYRFSFFFFFYFSVLGYSHEIEVKREERWVEGTLEGYKVCAMQLEHFFDFVSLISQMERASTTRSFLLLVQRAIPLRNDVMRHPLCAMLRWEENWKRSHDRNCASRYILLRALPEDSAKWVFLQFGRKKVITQSNNY